MFKAKFVRENLERVKAAIEARGESISLEKFVSLDLEVRDIISEAEGLRRVKNRVSAEIAELKRDEKDVRDRTQKMKEVSSNIKELERRKREAEEELNEILTWIPNLPHSSVPVGEDETSNLVVREGGERREFAFPPLPHWKLGESLGILDFAQGARLSGTHFPCYKGLGAQLERALVNFMLDLHVRKHGYTEIFPPFLANRESMFGSGQLPKLEGDMYVCEADDYFLNPTGEVPLINLHRGETLREEELPKRYATYTACFRREAGSYGRATKGLLRVHQFNKVELVAFTVPEDSYDELETLLSHAEQVVKSLGLPYRISLLSTGELPFASAKTYDVEVWAPGANRWLEVSSVSNTEDFQARRANLRFRRGAKTEHLHTLNGSGVATPRTFAALVENFQQGDGSILLPEVLRPYLGGLARIG